MAWRNRPVVVVFLILSLLLNSGVTPLTPPVQEDTTAATPTDSTVGQFVEGTPASNTPESPPFVAVDEVDEVFVGSNTFLPLVTSNSNSTPLSGSATVYLPLISTQNSGITPTLTPTPIITPDPVALSQFSATPLIGPPPLLVNFSVSLNAPAAEPITYTWNFGDGATESSSLLMPASGVTDLTSSHQYLTEGDFTASINVVDKLGRTASSQTTLRSEVVTQILVNTPSQGEGNVSVTRETFIRFSDALDATTVTSNTIRAEVNGQLLPYRLHLSTNRKEVTLFYVQPLPTNSRVRVIVDGEGLRDSRGRKVDADHDGLQGGAAYLDFDTVSQQRIPGTQVWGFVYDAYNKNPDGSDIPLAGVTIRVDGIPEANATTDANGYFLLEDMPAPVFFVHIDGSTATNAPTGMVYATVGKAFHSVAGQTRQLFMDGLPFHVYLPSMTLSDMQTLQTDQPTKIQFGAAGKNEVEEMFPTLAQTVWERTYVDVPPNAAIDAAGNKASQAVIIPVPADRLPAPLPPGMNHQLDIAVIVPGATNFDTPAAACFPNLPDKVTGLPLPPGGKSALISFNHDTGQWEVVGPMTVSADGQLVCTDPGVGIRAPGWHGRFDGGLMSVGGYEVNFSHNNPPENPPPPCSPGTFVSKCEEKIFNVFVGAAVTPAACSGSLVAWPAILACFASISGTYYYYIKTLECYDTCGQTPLVTNMSKVFPPIPLSSHGELQSKTNGEELNIMILQFIQNTRPLIEELYNVIRSGVIKGSLSVAEQQQIADLLVKLDDKVGGSYAEKSKQLSIDLLKASASTTRIPISAPSHYLVVSDQKLALRGKTSVSGNVDLVVNATSNPVAIMFFSQSEWKVGTTWTSQVPVGTRIILPDYELVEGVGETDDQDSDKLPDIVEVVVGTEMMSADSDGDGLLDGDEVRNGSDPLDGKPARTGIIASVDTPGNAQDICARNDLAAVADGAAGVAIFDIRNPDRPMLLKQVATQGIAQRVACVGNRVVVADEKAGVAILDISDPANARRLYQVRTTLLGGIPQSLVAAGGIAYVGLDSGRIVSIDLTSGTILDRTGIEAAVQDLALAGETLYALSINKLHLLPLNQSVLTPTLTTEVANGSFRLFVGGDIAYVTRSTGYSTYNLNTGGAPVLITQGNTGQNNWAQIVPNGSGLGVAVMGVDPRFPPNIHLYNVGVPTQTNQFITTFDTPGQATATALYNGFAYVADGTAGLHVVNYLAYDIGKTPPTLSLSTNYPPGEAEEGQRVRVSAVVSDDVQVRSVEFFVDGVKVATDGNFPFEHRLVAPRRSQQPSFLLRANAWDTGGNLTTTGDLTVTLSADTVAPQIVRLSPRNNDTVGNAGAVAAFFNEPLDPASLTPASFTLLAAGNDNRFDTLDDSPITTSTLEFRANVLGAFLTVPGGLPPGRYRAEITNALKDMTGNALKSGQRWSFRTFNLADDNDADCVPNAVEPLLSLNPENPDSDGNGVSDGDEDFDLDGLSNCSEGIFKTDPANPDSDGDGILDGQEDIDGDDLSNEAETIYGTDPLNADTDSDTFWDGLEVAVPSDPLDPESTPYTASNLPGEAVSPVYSIVNLADPSAPNLPGEAVSPVFSIVNLADPSAKDLPGEAVSPVVSIINTSDPNAPNLPGEADSPVYSTENTEGQ